MASARRKTPTEDPVLRRYEAQLRDLQAQLAELGFFCKGTVLARKMKCGTATCACQSDPAQRHGPYFEWTYKAAAKTVHLHLQPKEADIYEQATQEWRRLRKLLQRMEKLSRRAIDRKAKIRKKLRPTQSGKISRS
jgi:hypothetical protein